ncbi:DNA-binding protein, putative [Wolbachia endosymbiont of Drosophila ananassae]|nr:DNA-binding protein, putative [Wolbachia endosymbiont of Drosophila ananassae]
MELGKKIKELRLYCGLTQTELGKKIGVSYRQIQRYENVYSLVHQTDASVSLLRSDSLDEEDSSGGHYSAMNTDV